MFRPAIFIAVAAALTAPLVAQDIPPPPAPPTLPGQSTVQLQFGPSTDVKDVLEHYQRWTGKRIIYDSTTIGPVPIVINELVPKEEAVKIVEMALIMNGFPLIPTEDPKILKVFGQGKSPRSGPVPLYTEAEMLPEREQIVTFLFKLVYADPTELAQTLGAAFPPNPALAGGQSIVPLPKSQAILVTENTPIIRQIIRVVRELDVAPAEVVSRFFTLLRADAKEVQEKLETILTQQQPGQTTPTPGGAAPPRPQVVRTRTTPEGVPLPVDAPATVETTTTTEITFGPNEESFVAGRVKITADPRTNRLHVIARPKALLQIAALIEEFDANVPFGEPAVRPLQFVNAADIFDVIVKSITDPGQTADAAATATTGAQGGRPTQGAGAATTGNLFNNANRGNTGLGATGGGLGGGGGGAGSLSESLNAGDRDIVPTAVTLGNTRIIADKRNNAIIVLGTRDVREKVFKVIDRLDVRAPQVMLHTCIGQLTLGNTEQFGINYIVNQGRALDSLTGAPATGTGTAGGGAVNTGSIASNALNLSNLLGQEQVRNIAIGGASGLSGFFTAGNAFNAIVTALSSTNRFRVVSNPMVFASNNKKAIIASGEEIAVPTNIQSGFGGSGTGNNLVTNSTIQYKTVALTLEILPLINSEREVTLDIVQKIDEQNGFDLIDGNQIPRIATRVLQTTVSVPNEATLVLGGLVKQRTSKDKSGIPILSKIPVIGGLFRTTTDAKSREELIILIRPVVTFGPGESVNLREREQDKFNIEADLEATLIPEGIRQRVPAEPVMRVQPVLRETTTTHKETISIQTLK